ncbi:VPLPA-CTERM sorting domain-containing protein [Paracoccus sp. MC1854]|uniref:VPLPA-CTERM sorting domain-containing protein n=1 Tax=Paracoccus sp. MC1854 TaxID=2760306 RepID=UPI001602C961|nr:VPLPA-CTERM sorting domain-containing protein [Paracoccus sp. MC1854]MBB1492634.1 VPLPA-CTERM sorting domain-containing protein [Paracoccus sp. MC1854]
MNICKYLSAAALAAALSVGTASAATFTIERGDVNVKGQDFCVLGDCKLEGVVLKNSFDLDTVGESANIDSLFDWNIALTSPWTIGKGVYDVQVSLNFSSPSDATAGGSGHAGFFTAFGKVSGGALKWSDGSGTVAFGDGHVLNYSFKDALAFGLGSGTTTGATFTLAQAPAPVPLPASALLLLAGMGALGSVRAYRKHKV